MIPDSLIHGLVEETGINRAICISIYAACDFYEGQVGWPIRGFRYLAAVLGIDERVVAKNARYMERRGWLELSGDTEGAGARQRVVLHVRHNPARQDRFNPDCLDIGFDRHNIAPRKTLPRPGPGGPLQQRSRARDAGQVEAPAEETCPASDVQTVSTACTDVAHEMRDSQGLGLASKVQDGQGRVTETRTEPAQQRLSVEQLATIFNGQVVDIKVKPGKKKALGGVRADRASA